MRRKKVTDIGKLWKRQDHLKRNGFTKVISIHQIFATESPLKMMKNAFYFTLKAIFVFKIFKFLFRLFGHVENGLIRKKMVNFKTYDVIAWETNNCNAHIAQYPKK